LDFDIVEISSVYIDDSNSIEKNIIKDVSLFLDMNDILLVDYHILHEDDYYFFFDVYADATINKNDMYDNINEEISNKY